MSHSKYDGFVLYMLIYQILNKKTTYVCWASQSFWGF